jgi:uroporphyrinogen-III decarboxylase
MISDLPKGKCVWYFDRTDMVRAKATVGRRACIMGNFPVALLCAGTPDEVRAECKSLMQAMKPDGGYIFSTGAGIQGSKPENVKAMIETAKELS